MNSSATAVRPTRATNWATPITRASTAPRAICNCGTHKWRKKKKEKKHPTKKTHQAPVERFLLSPQHWPNWFAWIVAWGVRGFEKIRKLLCVVHPTQKLCARLIRRATETRRFCPTVCRVVFSAESSMDHYRIVFRKTQFRLPPSVSTALLGQSVARVRRSTARKA